MTRIGTVDGKRWQADIISIKQFISAAVGLC